MNCRCGSKLIDKGIDEGCQIYSCPNNKKCGQSYRFPLHKPLDHPPDFMASLKKQPEVDVTLSNHELMLSPQLKVDVSIKCKVCGDLMSLIEAKESFEVFGKATCQKCQKSL